MEMYLDEIVDGLESPNSGSTSSINGDYVKLDKNLGSDITCRTASSSSIESGAYERVKLINDVSKGARLMLEDIRFVQRLGSGDIGTVYLVELKGHEGHLLAAKVMCKEELACRNKEGRAGVEREILEMLDHPFLPSLYATLDSPKWSCLLTEFCPGGDLHILRQRQPERRFDEDAVRWLGKPLMWNNKTKDSSSAVEVVAALEYLHMLGIVYRDLKPENVLVRSDGHIMLTDFDLSMKCDNSTSSAHLVYDEQPRSRRSHSSPNNANAKFSISSCILPRCVIPRVSSCLHPLRRKRRPVNSGRPKVVAEPIEARSMSFVGTHEYLAPEIVTGEGHGNGVDWWTLGIFIYELLYGVTPFRGRDNEFTLSNIVARGLEFPKEPIVSGSFKNLIGELLNKNPSKRMGSMMGATAIKHHPFFQGVNWALLRCTVPPFVPKPFKFKDVDVTFDDVHHVDDVDYY